MNAFPHPTGSWGDRVDAHPLALYSTAQARVIASSDAFVAP